MHLDHAELQALFTLWQQTGGARLPARREFTPADLKRWMGNLAIIRLVPPHGRLRVDLVGTRIVEIDGYDSTGRFLDEIAPPHATDILLEPYRNVLDHAQPHYHSVVPPSRPTTAVHRLLLPLADDGVTIDRILSGVCAEPAAAKPGATVFDQLDPAARRHRAQWARLSC
ncbi:PAS domain-containing protein [Rhodovibrio sodomensis]|nr:PAS domain-containing protein [Rhodovibrio sodomensis]